MFHCRPYAPRARSARKPLLPRQVVFTYSIRLFRIFIELQSDEEEADKGEKPTSKGKKKKTTIIIPPVRNAERRTCRSLMLLSTRRWGPQRENPLTLIKAILLVLSFLRRAYHRQR